MMPDVNPVAPSQFAAEQPTATIGPRGWFALLTGLNLAFALCSLTCKSPAPLSPSWRSRLFTAAIYLALACLTGTFGTWIMFPRSSRPHFRILLCCGLRGWVFLPAIVLWLQRESVWAPLLAIGSATLLAAYMDRSILNRKDTQPHLKDTAGLSHSQHDSEWTLFSIEVRPETAFSAPFGISLCLYGAFFSDAAGRPVLVTLLLSVAAFLLALQITAAQSELRSVKVETRPLKSHPYTLIAFAFCSIVFALSGSQLDGRLPSVGWLCTHSSRGFAKQKSPQDRESPGYHAIVLWPVTKKEKIIPSPAVAHTAASQGQSKPWVIHFNGPYWYFRSPGETPGPNARTTRGDPLEVNVRSTDRTPLLMEAHQYLPDPVNLTCCREIQVVLRNDSSMGTLAVGLSLTDSRTKLSQSLGTRYVPHPPGDQGAAVTTAIEETLVFPFPHHSGIKTFDAMTVTLLPDAKHLTAGRKVAIDHFTMIPN